MGHIRSTRRKDLFHLAKEQFATVDCVSGHTKERDVPLKKLVQDLEPSEDQGEGSFAMRLTLLEMLVALMAARLPKEDLDEVVGLLVFVANASREASETHTPGDLTKLASA